MNYILEVLNLKKFRHKNMGRQNTKINKQRQNKQKSLHKNQTTRKLYFKIDNL